MPEGQNEVVLEATPLLFSSERNEGPSLVSPGLSADCFTPFGADSPFSDYFERTNLDIVPFLGLEFSDFL